MSSQRILSRYREFSTNLLVGHILHFSITCHQFQLSLNSSSRKGKELIENSADHVIHVSYEQRLLGIDLTPVDLPPRCNHQLQLSSEQRPYCVISENRCSRDASPGRSILKINSVCIDVRYVWRNNVQGVDAQVIESLVLFPTHIDFTQIRHPNNAKNRFASSTLFLRISKSYEYNFRIGRCTSVSIL